MGLSPHSEVTCHTTNPSRVFLVYYESRPPRLNVNSLEVLGFLQRSQIKVSTTRVKRKIKTKKHGSTNILKTMLKAQKMTYIIGDQVITYPFIVKIMIWTRYKTLNLNSKDQKL